MKDGNEAEIGKALFSAMNQNNLDDFNLILEDPKCTTEMLAKSYDDNNSVLEHAGTTQVDEMFLSSILNSPKFTTKLLLTEYPLLMLAIHSGNRDTVKLILDSPKCTTDVLLMRPEKLDMNPFLFAVEQRLPNPH